MPMRLRDPNLLAAHMRAEDCTQARLGRRSGVSRQFIHQLVHGRIATCTPEVAALIEETLAVPPGALFVPKKSPVTGRTSKYRRTA